MNRVGWSKVEVILRFGRSAVEGSEIGGGSQFLLSPPIYLTAELEAGIS